MSDTRAKLIAVLAGLGLPAKEEDGAAAYAVGYDVDDVADAIIEAFPGVGLEPLGVEAVVNALLREAERLNALGLTPEYADLAHAVVAAVGTEPKPALSEDEGPLGDVQVRHSHITHREYDYCLRCGAARPYRSPICADDVPNDVVEAALGALRKVGPRPAHGLSTGPRFQDYVRALADAGLLRGQVPPEYVALVKALKHAEGSQDARDALAVSDALAAIEQREVQA